MTWQLSCPRLYFTPLSYHHFLQSDRTVPLMLTKLLSQRCRSIGGLAARRSARGSCLGAKTSTPSERIKGIIMHFITYIAQNYDVEKLAPTNDCPGNKWARIVPTHELGTLGLLTWYFSSYAISCSRCWSQILFRNAPGSVNDWKCSQYELPPKIWEWGSHWEGS